MAVVLVAMVVVSGVWAWSGVVASPVVALEDAPSTYRYDPELEVGEDVYWGGDHEVSLSEDGRSVGLVNQPFLPLFARGALVDDEGGFLYMVADVREDGSGRDLWSLEPPPGTPAPHPGESQLSGDGLTFVATFNDVGWVQGPCDEGDPGVPPLVRTGWVWRW